MRTAAREPALSLACWPTQGPCKVKSPLSDLPRTAPGALLLLLLGLAGLFGSLFALGRLTHQGIRDLPRYQVPFTDVECAAPPSLSRTEFLAEVQYLAELPERLRLLDDGLAARLRSAFAAHPWVEKVERVALVPPRQVRVWLVFRTPVLVVLHAGRTRTVDAAGVVLPATAPQAGLPEFHARAAPAGAAGTVWDDADVLAAARTAGFLHAQQGQLGLTRWRASDDGLEAETATGVRVLWGRPPGAELAGEPTAAEKLERLRRRSREHGGLDNAAGPRVHDLRR